MYGMKIINLEFFENLHFYILFFGEFGIGIKKSTFLYISLHHVDYRGRKNVDCLMCKVPKRALKKL